MPIRTTEVNSVTICSQVCDGFWLKGHFQEALQKKMKKENILFFSFLLEKKTKCFHSWGVTKQENIRSINIMQLLNESI